ncbi:ABC transporter permease subunit [Vulgatibacter incomptus]|uniref:Uncharacterized protein n=1 Tax=Vulgatibacter incomptus TaxID=1391653 RepID=A0A0K1PFE7_9BACT|nr:hypothetical protein AKJ08_2226 [Vulgatibacter incomptus]
MANVALDLLREALSRKWFLALGAGITLLLALLALSLRLEVADGALAATRLFGTDMGATDTAMKAILGGAASLVFYGGVVFGIVACADFGPSLLAPGRVELMLALPIRRWELLVGTWLGVFAIATLGALYGAGGLTLVLGLKAGLWTPGPLLASLLGSATFAGIYAAMLAATTWVRSAAVSAAAGFAVFFAGIVAGHRDDILPAFAPGVGRAAFSFLSSLFPRISSLGSDAIALAASGASELDGLAWHLGGLAIFGLSCLAFATWRFEGRDF